MADQAIIKISKLFKTYKGSKESVLNGIDLTINKDEIYGILGPNGAGKTTLISLICGLLKPTQGSVKINDLEVNTNSLEIKNLIGVVPQDIALYPTLTAYENLSFFGSMYGLYGKNLNEKINYYLRKFDLLSVSNVKVLNFSGGMKRKINLIASILHQPKILILDEPTVGVDVASRNVIIEHLKKLNAEGTTIIYSSHHLEEASEFCTQIAILNQGKIITKGTVKELINSVEKSHSLEDVFLTLTTSTYNL